MEVKQKLCFSRRFSLISVKWAKAAPRGPGRLVDFTPSSAALRGAVNFTRISRIHPCSFLRFHVILDSIAKPDPGGALCRKEVTSSWPKRC